MKRKRGGFTIVEMLTVIGVLMLLMTMAVLGYRMIATRSESDQTRVTLQNLASMLNEFEQKGGDLSIVDARGGYTATSSVAAPTDLVSDGGPSRNSAPVIATRRIMKVLLRDQVARSIYDNIPGKRVHDDNTNGPVLLDGWGNPIIYVPRGGLSGVGKGSRAKPGDANPTFALPNQTIHSPEWVANAPSPNTTGKAFFASAGSDKRFDWGDDNVYSFER